MARDRQAGPASPPSAAQLAQLCERLRAKLGERPLDHMLRHQYARALYALGRHDAARSEYAAVLAAAADYAPTLIETAIDRVHQQDPATAKHLLGRVGADGRAAVRWHFGSGLVALAENDLPAAEAHFRDAIAIDPRYAVAHQKLGLVLRRLQRSAAAARALEAAAALEPRLPGLLRELGCVYEELGEARLAEPVLLRAVAVDASDAEAHLHLGNVVVDGDRAERHLRQAQALRPNDPQLAIRAARTLERRERSRSAEALLRAACASGQDHPDLLAELSRLLSDYGHNEAALECCEQVLKTLPDHLPMAIQRARLLEASGRLTESIEAFESAIALAPEHADSLRAEQLVPALRLCRWDRTEATWSRLYALPNGIDLVPSFWALSGEFSGGQCRSSAERRARDSAPGDCAPAAPRRRGARLRICYLSADFREHPVAHSLAAVIEHHDRRLLETHALALTQPDESAMGRRFRRAFEHFVDGSALSDAAIAALLRERGIDIAIDLTGLTAGERPGIFARRAAPIQINYLGYPGTTGYPNMDYLVADATVIPAGSEQDYSERVIRLPHCYLPFDNGRAVDPGRFTRAALGLPATGFVFCGFTTAYKLGPRVFASWLELLAAVPGSVLWLRDAGAETNQRLQALALRRGIAAERLVIARPVAADADYLGRLAHADLLLDTSPYNAHTTGAEALYAGVPLVTCPGTRFASRVGASLLSACQLEQLIATDLEDYRARALTLALDEDRHRLLRERLVEERHRLALFDTVRYTRDLESLFAATAAGDGAH